MSESREAMVIDARRVSGTVLLLAVTSVSGAWAEDVEDFAMRHVRLSTDASIAAGCARMARISDDSLKDLRRKVVRAGGNTAVLSFESDDLSKMLADVYRCTPPPAARRPPNVPPPPAGTPPPPPPAGAAPASGATPSSRPPAGGPPPPPPAGPPPPPPPPSR